MRNSIFFILLYSIIFPLDISINISPDTIFVGSLVSIKLSVENNFESEVFSFNDIETDLDNYIQLNKKLFACVFQVIETHIFAVVVFSII